MACRETPVSLLSILKLTETMPSWTEIPIHVIDFEGSRKSGIVEFGIVTLLDGSISETSTSLCSASGQISKHEVAQHGLTSAQCSPYPPFSEHWDRFRSLRQTGVLAAHHAAVEFGLIRSIWPCPPLSPDFSNENQSIAEWGPWVDSCKLAQRLLPNLESYKLGDLIESLALEAKLKQLANEHCPPSRNRYHCALYDTLASALIILNLMAGQDAKLRWLIAESAASENERSAGHQTELF